MAITNAQQYKQLLAQGGRIGFQGGGKDSSTISSGDFKARDYSPAEKKDQQRTADLNQRISKSERGQQQTANTQAAINRTEAKAKAEKEKRKNFIKDYIKNRQKLAFNASMLIPGQKKRSAKYQKAYKDYLESMGVTPPDTLTGEEDDLADFFVNNAFDKPVAADANVQAPQSYGDFLLENFGAPGVKFSGNVGGKEVYVKGTRPDGSKIYDVREERGGGRDDFILPISQPVASIPEPTGYVNPLSLLTPRIAGTRFLGTEFEEEDDTEFAANGGRIGAMGGGIMNTDVMGGLADGGMDESGRQMYFLGKLVKKAGRALKKITKSPFGKAALLGGLAYFGGGGGLPKFLSSSSKGLGGFSMKTLFSKANPLLFTNDKLSMGKLGLLSAATPFLFPGEEDNSDEDMAKYLASQQLNENAPLYIRSRGTDFYAADGGMPSKEPVAKKTMPLLDMDGQEMDLRAEGGFVPLGRMERADDVPARLSKNEFVFTADAVRNAGEGDIDKGAEVMYNMMKNLESGGEVSEESQGLEGARDMFKTSQRLEEVL